MFAANIRCMPKSGTAPRAAASGGQVNCASRKSARTHEFKRSFEVQLNVSSSKNAFVPERSPCCTRVTRPGAGIRLLTTS